MHNLHEELVPPQKNIRTDISFKVVNDWMFQRVGNIFCPQGFFISYIILKARNSLSISNQLGAFHS